MINRGKFLNLKVTALKSKNKLHSGKLINLKNSAGIKETRSKSYIKTNKK